jgi:hypothetical protein
VSRSGRIAILAVALVFFASLAYAESFAEFEQRAMTRLFVLAALDTLVGARMVAAVKHKKREPAGDAPGKTLPAAKPSATRQPSRQRHRPPTPRRRGDDHDRAALRR